MKEIWKSRKGTIVLLVIALAAMLWTYLESAWVGDDFQHVFTPATQTVTLPDGGESFSNGLREARVEAREVDKALEGACTGFALYAVQDPASVSVKDGDSASARLHAIDESFYAVHNFTLYCGRMIYPDELLYGQHVAMVDEQLAVSLFQYAEPLERKIIVGETEYTIVGVLRSAKQVGPKADYSLYIPYRAAEKTSDLFTELIYEAKPVEGAGGWVSFQTEAQRLGTGGTTINLEKEGMNAAMPQRMYVCFLGFVIGLALLRRVMFHVKHFMREYKEKLQTNYAVKLLPWLVLRWIAAIACIVAGTALMVQLFVWIVAPVYTFPEWVPAVLVEPKDIQKAFWNVWRAGADMVELRTPQLTRLRFIRELAGWSTGFAAFLTAYLMGSAFPKLFGVRKSRKERESEREELQD